MFLYFYLLEQVFFNGLMSPLLAQSYQRRSFGPCLELCRFLLATDPGVPADAVVRAVLNGLPFDRIYWHGLVGECLVHGASDIPRLQTAPDSLCCLLGSAGQDTSDVPRCRYAPIQQVHFGTRDLRFGAGYYRPDHAGLNDTSAVIRLAGYLESIHPNTWDAEALSGLPDCQSMEQRAEELADLRDWWPSLVELYQRARERELVIVCETI